MNKQSGKTTFMSLIMFVILVLGGFMAFKYLSSGFTKKQIKTEVYDTLGTIRGGKTGTAKLMDTIEEVLKKNKVEILNVFAEIDQKNVIHYSFKYKINTDYLLFKRNETIEVVNEMENYGL